jgi:cell division protein FtsB
MASRAPGDHRNHPVKRRTRATLLLSFAGRMAVAAVAVLVLVLAGVQFTREIGANLALQRELDKTNADIASLQARHDRDSQKMHRLESPEGAVPEIHSRLRLVRPNEAIIFVSPAPTATPTAAP